jgi:hypothetical protein
MSAESVSSELLPTFRPEYLVRKLNYFCNFPENNVINAGIIYFS